MAALSGAQIAQYAAQAGFTGQGLVNIVAIAKRESGWDPSAYNGNASTGDNSVGLTQVNLIGNLLPARGAILNQLGYNVDPNDRAAVTAALQNPLINMQVAYVMSSGGTDFYPWGGYKGQSDTYGTDIPEAAAAVQQAGLDGGTGMANTSGGGGGSPDYGGAVSQLQDVINELAANRPQAKDYTTTTYDDQGNPVGTKPDGASYQTALQQWTQNYTDAVKALQGFQQQQVGLTTLPDGSVVAAGDLSPDQQQAIQASNYNNYANLLNQLGLSNYNLLKGVTDDANSNIQSSFQDTISSATTKMAVDQSNFNKAVADINRWTQAQNVASGDQSAIAAAKQQIGEWGTTNGQTAFTPEQLGSGVTALAGQANLPTSQPIIQFPGYMTLNPVQDRLNSLAAMGVSNAPPTIPAPTVTMNDIPGTPQFMSAPPRPALIAPMPPPIYSGAATGAGTGTTYMTPPPNMTLPDPNQIAGIYG